MDLTRTAGSRLNVSLGLAALSLLGLCARPAAAQNLVTNPGFETGDFTGWTLTGDTFFDYVSSTFTANSGLTYTPHSGTYFAVLGSSGLDSSLTQTAGFATVAGQSYVFSFYLASDGDTPNDFSASFDGTTVFSATDLPSTLPDYTLYSFTVTPTTTTSNVSFTFRNDNGFLSLDDVSVTPSQAAVPEPPQAASLGLGALGVLGLLVKARRRKAADT